MTKNIRAVFWDIDGTMVMSEPVHRDKMTHVASLHGVMIGEDHSRFHGAGDTRAYEILKEMGMNCLPEDFASACYAYYEAQLHTIEVREGFLEAFELLDQKGIAQGAVSNGADYLVTMNIGRTGIGHRLKVAIDLNYIESKGLQPKPFADPYLEALRRVNEELDMSIQPEECLVVEDSPTGIQAGKAAGMHTVFWKLTPEKTCPEADFEAYSGLDLMHILRTHYL